MSVKLAPLHSSNPALENIKQIQRPLVHNSQRMRDGAVCIQNETSSHRRMVEHIK